MKKSLGFLSTFLFSIFSANAHAFEDYAEAAARFNWIPQNLDLPLAEPYKDFYVHSVVFAKTPANTFKMTIKLPEDLSAGESTMLELLENQREVFDDAEFPTTKFTFVDDKGSRLICDVADTWLHANCVVGFLHIPKSATERRAYVTSKYRGTVKERGLADIAYHIDSEPFGDLNVSPANDINSGSLYGNGQWSFQYQNPRGMWVSGHMTIDFERGVYRPDRSPNAALLTGFVYTDNTAEGTWTFDEHTFGWFKFTFFGDHFTGFWGTYDSLDPVGQWNGTRR